MCLVDVHDYQCVICGHVLSRLLSHFVLCGVLNPLSAGHLVSPVMYFLVCECMKLIELNIGASSYSYEP